MRLPDSVREHVPLAPLTTLEVGGPARYLAQVRDEAGLAACLTWADDRGLAVHVLGGGSNALVSDRGLEGLVLKIASRGIEVEAQGDGEVLVHAAAGEPWDDFVDWAVARDFAGLECLAGIPGLVGATPIQNVGAYGQEVREAIAQVRALDRASGAHVELAPEACRFGYRTSRFKEGAPGRFVVTRVTFRLRRGGAPALRYAELARRFPAGPSVATLAEVRAAVLEIRRSKSMVLEAEDPNRRSVGSFFVNPTLRAGEHEILIQRLRGTPLATAAEQMPRHPVEGGGVKLSAAWLIEQAGFPRGTSRGAVGLSTRHALALVNRGGATAADVVAFATEVRARVLERFGVRLAPEPVLLGFREHEIAGLIG